MVVNPLVTPAINISASNTTICPNESVTFTATPTNEGSNPTYQWQVNGVNTGSNSSTLATSTLSNNDVVTCILTSSENCTSTNNVASNSVTITVNTTTPVSSFTYTSNELDYTFTNTSSGATGYLWNFGDGTTSTLQNPTHTYSITGTYTVTLTAYGPCDSSQVIQSVNVISAINNPQASFTVGIYPNPANGIVTVDLNGYESNDVEVSLFDGVGKKLYSYKLQNSFGNSKVNVDLSSYEKGIYYFNIRFDNETQHFKVIHK
jgi:PKD repeat protein